MPGVIGSLSSSLFVLEVRTGDRPYGGTNSYPYVRFWGVSKSGQEIMSEWMCLNSPGTSHAAHAVDRYAFTWRSDVQELYRIEIQLRRINDDFDRTVSYASFRLYSFEKPSADWILACDFGAREVKPTETGELPSGTFSPFYAQSCVPGKPMQEVGHSAIAAQLVAQMLVHPDGASQSRLALESAGPSAVHEVGAGKAFERLIQAGPENLVE
jgi:hypothetical protein